VSLANGVAVPLRPDHQHGLFVLRQVRKDEILITLDGPTQKISSFLTSSQAGRTIRSRRVSEEQFPPRGKEVQHPGRRWISVVQRNPDSTKSGIPIPEFVARYSLCWSSHLKSTDHTAD